MSSESVGQRSRAWKPKAFRPTPPPTPEECDRLLQALKPCASDSTYQHFRRLAYQGHDSRLAEAFQTVIDSMIENPRLSDAMQQALTVEEIGSYMEVSRLPIPGQAKDTAEKLLNGLDRQVLVSFLRRAFRDLRAYPSLHPFDTLKEEQ